MIIFYRLDKSLVQDPCYILYYCLQLCVYTHIYITDIVKIVREDYTVLTSKQLGEASLQLLTACVPLTFIGVVMHLSLSIPTYPNSGSRWGFVAICQHNLSPGLGHLSKDFYCF